MVVRCVVAFAVEPVGQYFNLAGLQIRSSDPSVTVVVAELVAFARKQPTFHIEQQPVRPTARFAKDLSSQFPSHCRRSGCWRYR